MYGIDMIEDIILTWGNGILDTLLLDRTTGENIIWATDDYAAMGEAYTFFHHITPELITGKNKHVIQPRVSKKEAEQRLRSRKMAEVFTPSWVCNEMNNRTDESWFKYKPVFNNSFTQKSNHFWEPTSEKIVFPNGKTWQEYVSGNVMEITCGEAPFLVSRYDTVTGEPISDIHKRIGLLDRKIRIVNENTSTKEDWFYWVIESFKSTFGFEWQGDNLLLARENILISCFDYCEDRWGEEPPMDYVKKIAEIISWNIFQMDGLKFVIPRSCHPTIVKTRNLLSGEIIQKEVECEGCKKKLIHHHTGIYVKVMDWKKGQIIRFDQINGLALTDKLW